MRPAEQTPQAREHQRHSCVIFTVPGSGIQPHPPGGGTTVLVVSWCWQDRLWDIKGFVTREEAEGAWCQQGEQLEDFEGDDVVRLVDPNNVFAGGFDADRFKQALVDELTKAGLPVNPDLTPSSPKAKGPFGPF